MTQTELYFLRLVQCGVGCRDIEPPKVDVDWRGVYELSVEHGVLCICLDAIGQLPLEKKPSEQLLMDWIASVLHWELLYEKHKKLLRALCGSVKDVRVLLLKGIGLSVYYPVPKHRPTGDIDIYSYGCHEAIDNFWLQMGLKPMQMVEKHSVVTIGEVTIENHSLYVDAFATKAERQLQAYLETLNDDVLTEDGYYVPSPVKNYLFLLSHMARHFSEYQSVTLRHILDWGLFLKGEYDNLMEQQSLISEKLEEFGLTRCNDVFTAIAEDVVCMDFGSLIKAEVLQTDKDRIMKDIFMRKTNREPKGLLPRVWHKMRRLYDNWWKYKYLPFSFWERVWFSVRLHWKNMDMI